MRILIATPYYYPQTGGLENYARHIADGLRGLGHHVAVVCGDNAVTELTATTLDGYTVYRLPIWKVFSNTPIHPAWPKLLKQVIATEHPDIINVHAPVVFMVDMVALVAGKTPVAVTYHAATLEKPASPLVATITAAYGLAQHFTFRRANRIIAVSQYVKDCLPAALQAKTSVVTNAVPAVRPARKQAGTGLVFIANLEPTHAWKGLDAVLESFHVLKQQGQAIPKLTVIGDGADRARYEAKVAALNIQDHVEFAGRLTGVTRDDRTAEAAALVMYPTTANDAFPTVLVEAWSLGLAVIASAIGPMPSLIEDGKTGQLVEPSNPTALADAIRRLMADPILTKTMGEHGRQLVAQQYTWPHSVKHTAAIFEAML